MIILFEIIILTTIWNIGIEIILSDGMALQNLRKWAESKGKGIYEVGIWCLWCRPTIHSLFGYGAAIGLGLVDKFEWKLIWIYPLSVCGTSALSGIIWSIYKLIEIKTLYYKHKEQNEFFDLKNRKQNYFNNKK